MVSGLRVLGFRFRGLGFRGWGCRVQGLDWDAFNQGLGFEVPLKRVFLGLGFRFKEVQV